MKEIDNENTLFNNLTLISFKVMVCGCFIMVRAQVGLKVLVYG